MIGRREESQSTTTRLVTLSAVSVAICTGPRWRVGKPSVLILRYGLAGVVAYSSSLLWHQQAIRSYVYTYRGYPNHPNQPVPPSQPEKEIRLGIRLQQLQRKGEKKRKGRREFEGATHQRETINFTRVAIRASWCHRPLGLRIE